MDAESMSHGWTALGALIRRARNDLRLSQAAVVELLNRDLDERGHPKVHQSVVSDNERGERWRDRPELVGAYTRVLRLRDGEVVSTLYGVRETRTAEPTFEELVQTDPSLDEASKEHIIKQYGLLRAATMHNRMSHRNALAHGRGRDRSEVTDEEIRLIDQAFVRQNDDGASPDSTESA